MRTFYKQEIEQTWLKLLSPGVQAWREDRTLIAASYLIAEALGQRYVDGIPLSMERVLEESGTARPVICLLSPGSLFSLLIGSHPLTTTHPLLSPTHTSRSLS